MGHYAKISYLRSMLQGKTALITGASRGIGKGIAEVFAKNGCNIAFTYASSIEKAMAFEQELKGLYGVKVKGYQSDAANFNQSMALAETVIADFGKIDCLINNAGITRDTLMLRMTEEQWDDVININLKSAFNLTKAFLKHFLGNRAGSIINMTSVVGVMGNAGQANYAASKAGMIGFTKSIAKELGSRNVRCNAVAPGFIETEMTHALDENVRKQWAESIPLKRGGSPEDVANVCLFLASDMSGYVTGQTLSVCGGMLM
ncbi:beta-ketoacyl-ACP reductase [Bacteroidota bacterium]|nr:beta-ketoacyl-ACP reductase [Bacteroidota bacterium]